MRTEIQLNLPSFDELVTEARSVAPVDTSRSMNVIKTAVPVRRLKVAAYCRVSTDKEDQESSIRIQQEHFTSEAAKHDDWKFIGIYADIVSGTKKEKRPELNRLLADCERGAVNLVLTKSISRFARNTTDLLSMVRSLTSRGTDIRFERENIDTRTMSSEFLLTILASLAEDESHSISSNCRWGLQKRFENGTYRAASAPYGYDLDDGNYAVNETEAEIVREIFRHFLDGETLASIARDLNDRGIPTKRAGQVWKGKEINPEWTSHSIRVILNNVSYTGDQIFQKCFTNDSFKMQRNRGQYPQFHHEDHHPAIIDRETFGAVQAKLDANKRHEPKAEKQYTTLSTMLTCAHCGSHLTRQVNKYGKVYWICHKHRKSAAACPLETIKEESFIIDFENLISELHADNSVIQDYLNSLRSDFHSHPRVQEIKARLSEITTEIDSLTHTRGRVRPADYQAKISSLNAEREVLETELNLMTDNRISLTEELLRVIHSGSFHFEESFRQITDSVTVFGRGHYIVNFRCGLAVEYDGR